MYLEQRLPLSSALDRFAATASKDRFLREGDASANTGHEKDTEAWNHSRDLEHCHLVAGHERWPGA